MRNCEKIRSGIPTNRLTAFPRMGVAMGGPKLACHVLSLIAEGNLLPLQASELEVTDELN